MNATVQPSEQLNPHREIEHAGTRMLFATPNIGTNWRVETIYSKEPSTLEWIAGLGPDELLLDVGANVGMYTIWAAATRGMRVLAFEPESQNYALLNQNIRLNKLQQRVKAYCLGLSDQQCFTDLFMADVNAGGSGHSVGAAIDYQYQPMPVVFQQGCIAFPLDHLVSRDLIPVPNHIKVDVDGIEPKVIAGALTTLKDTAVRSLLIEVNSSLDDHRAMVRTLNELGFRHDPAQVQRATRNDGPFKGIAEHVFQR